MVSLAKLQALRTIRRCTYVKVIRGYWGYQHPVVAAFDLKLILVLTLTLPGHHWFTYIMDYNI